jgi:hypothetical protein
VSPILGIFASQGRVAANSYESIATVLVGSGGSSSISFTSIPSTYKHLQIRVLARSTRATNSDGTSWRFNSDSGNNYSMHNLNTDGSGGVSAVAQTSVAQIEINRVAAANLTSTIFGAGVVDILDYADTNKYKTTRSILSYDANGSGEVYFSSGSWRSTSAINSITVTCAVNFAQYTSFALYGIKG